MLPFYLIRGTRLQEKLRRMYLDRANQIFDHIGKYLSGKDTILDIGCGTGSIAKLIKKKKKSAVTLVDVQYNIMCDQYPVIIYNGQKLPFADNQFTTSLLITVLHHTKDANQVIEEAKRVTSDKIIVIEDIFTDLPGRAITFVGDCLINWEFHSPQTNHTQGEWSDIFKSHKLRIDQSETFSLKCIGFPFKLGLFVLKK